MTNCCWFFCVNSKYKLFGVFDELLREKNRIHSPSTFVGETPLRYTHIDKDMCILILQSGNPKWNNKIPEWMLS